MMRQVALMVMALLMAAWVCAAETPATARVASRFVVVDVYVDSGTKLLAAWQVELKATKGDVQIVGVEGGERKDVYRDPPYYDPAALSGGRIILASYTTADNPPKGKLMVARVHLRTVGEYELGMKVIAAADEAEREIVAIATVSPASGLKAKE